VAGRWYSIDLHKFNTHNVTRDHQVYFDVVVISKKMYHHKHISFEVMSIKPKIFKNMSLDVFSS